MNLQEIQRELELLWEAIERCEQYDCWVSVEMYRRQLPALEKKEAALLHGGPKKYCPHGHEYAGVNLIIDRRGHRKCRECVLAEKRQAYRRKREASELCGGPEKLTIAERRSRKTHCPKGHEYAGRNLIVDSRGYWKCRECNQVGDRRAYSRNREARESQSLISGEQRVSGQPVD